MVTTKKVMVFDIDGVVVNSHLLAMLMALYFTGKWYGLKSWTTYDFVLQEVAKKKKSSVVQAGNLLFGDDVVRFSPAMRGAKRVLRYLCNKGVEIYFLSARSEKQREVTFLSLKTLLGAGVVHQNNLFLRPEGEDPIEFKLKILKSLHPDVYLDDSSRILTSIEVHHDSPCTLMLFDRPWNSDFNPDEHLITKIYGWADFLHFVGTLYSQL